MPAGGCRTPHGCCKGVIGDMSAEQTVSLVQRKARTERDAHAARAMSLGRALRLTASKQAGSMMDLALGVLGVTRKTVSAADLPEYLDPEGLILLMDGAGTQVAAAVFDSALVAGFIQQQTMGRVTPVSGTADQRAHTATDAALCAPFIETLLSRAALLPEEVADRELLEGYRFGVWAQEQRQAQLALDAPEYEVIEMMLDLAAGARNGKLVLVLAEQQKAEEPEEEGESTPNATLGSKKLVHNVLAVRADLTVALTRMTLPLSQITAFKPDDVLDLNLSSMTQALVVDANGEILSRGTLGQVDGMRALQVEPQKRREHSLAQRRVEDRADLDLPQVTVPQSDQKNAADKAAGSPAEPEVSPLADVDIFGDLPEEDSSTQTAVDEWDRENDAEEGEVQQKQVVW